MYSRQNLTWIAIFLSPELNTCHQAKLMFILFVEQPLEGSLTLMLQVHNYMLNCKEM